MLWQELGWLQSLGLESFCHSGVFLGKTKEQNVSRSSQQVLGGPRGSPCAGELQPRALPRQRTARPFSPGDKSQPLTGCVRIYSSSPGEQPHGHKILHVNKADVVRILFGQIYSLTVEQQPCLGFVPPVINVHPGLCFPSGQCPSACLCVRL